MPLSRKLKSSHAGAMTGKGVQGKSHVEAEAKGPPNDRSPLVDTCKEGVWKG